MLLHSIYMYASTECVMATLQNVCLDLDNCMCGVLCTHSSVCSTLALSVKYTGIG